MIANIAIFFVIFVDTELKYRERKLQGRRESRQRPSELEAATRGGEGVAANGDEDKNMDFQVNPMLAAAENNFGEKVTTTKTESVWDEHTTDDGHLYYVNRATGETSWTIPTSTGADASHEDERMDVQATRSAEPVGTSKTRSTKVSYEPETIGCTLLAIYSEEEIDALVHEWVEAGKMIPKGLKKACKELKIKKKDVEEWLEGCGANARNVHNSGTTTGIDDIEMMTVSMGAV